jgi:lipopolysaccharide cholinephosphotransferase
MKKENYGSPIKLEFEGYFFNAPEHYHEVLTLGYGDYMQLPPVEKRYPYHTGTLFYQV